MPASKYVLDHRLGGGGMAEVFAARLVGTEGVSRRVAIKRVLPHLAADAAFVAMFIAEARLTAQLQHHNIVSLIDFDRDEEGRPFLVLELVDGPSLADLAATGALPIAAAAYVAAELLRALAYAHELSLERAGERGIVHRDISPHNVLLSWEGAVKLSDFGIARLRAASSATASGTIKGKPAYMSPSRPTPSRSTRAAICSPLASSCGSCSPAAICSPATRRKRCSRACCSRRSRRRATSGRRCPRTSRAS